jgi:hypothetical protein
MQMAYPRSAFQETAGFLDVTRSEETHGFEVGKK